MFDCLCAFAPSPLFFHTFSGLQGFVPSPRTFAAHLGSSSQRPRKRALRINSPHGKSTSTFSRVAMPNNPTILNNAPGVNNAAVAGMMHPPAFPLTPPTTPETSDKVTGEVILNSPHGTITGSCHRLQCLGYIVKIVTNQHDPKGWHLECNRKEDRVRPCNFRRDADGTVTKPLPRRPPPTPTKWRMQKIVGDAAQGPTPSTLAGKSGAQQTPVSSLSPSEAGKTSDIAASTPGDWGQTQKPPGTVNSTQGGQGQASKTFGSTQRILFPQTGKRAAGDTPQDSNAPATKRVCDPVRKNAPSNAAENVKDEFDDDIDMVWLDAATHLANAVESDLGSKIPAVLPNDRIGRNSVTPSHTINPMMTQTSTMNHQPGQQSTPAPPTAMPQYLARMAAFAQSAGSATLDRAVAMPPPAPSQHAMPPPAPRQRQKSFIGKPLAAWTTPAASAGKAPGCSQFEPIVLD
ncbi:hypothetical protein B0T18DRAFT_487173 [Schizothecium vesticola]|uniref:Uncharacterized protein n=1 Tax=Schizothecium vesticola TaxID=314040 RepID=A0AA40F1E6_9PEZI|nr:hypothetical protein B0T18DRAFT_487173 [Schizothecium vesticola]